MYECFCGELLQLLPTSAVIEVGGIGYAFAVPLSTYDRLKGAVARAGVEASEVRLYAHLYVREDELRLYGFATKEERRLFRMVLSVVGVGPAIALACLSALAPREVLDALAQGESKTLQRVKGVGRKVAERMIVDLKDRAGALVEENGRGAPALPSAGLPAERALRASEREDAVKALVELGYQRKAAVSMVASVSKQLVGRSEPADLEQLIKLCLRQ